MATSDYTSKNINLNTQRASQNNIRQSNDDFNLNPTTAEDNNLLQTSTNIFIFAGGTAVGMIQTFTVTENRPLTKLQAIGWEGVVQNVPGNTDGGTLNVTRLALYESSMWNALGMTTSGKSYNPLGTKVHNSTVDVTATNANGDYSHALDGDLNNEMKISQNSSHIFKTLKDQRTPFEIQVKTRMKGSTATNDPDMFYIETYIDCWLSSYTKTYAVGTITVTETATITYADVY